MAHDDRRDAAGGATLSATLYSGVPRDMLLAACAGLVVTAALTPLLAAWARRRNFLDIPNHRSSHVVATPRIGGVAIVIGVLAGLLAWHLQDGALDRRMLIVLTGALGIALLGVVDDFRHVPALVRLAVQTLIAAGVVIASGDADRGEGWLIPALTVFWLVTLVNAYNFMDGIDGIAGTKAVVAGCGWLMVGLVAGSRQGAALGILLAAASSGFLLYNWHPAKVFMGDGGSGFFGFLFAAVPLLSPVAQPALWLSAVLLMWPFLADTGFTLCRRASRGENVLSAHRSHIYQRLVITGRSHRDVALAYGGLALLGAIAAVSHAAGDRHVLALSSAAIVLAGAGMWWWVTARESAPTRTAV